MRWFPLLCPSKRTIGFCVEFACSFQLPPAVQRYAWGQSKLTVGANLMVVTGCTFPESWDRLQPPCNPQLDKLKRMHGCCFIYSL